MYPSEETARRNRWQDEYEAATREHQWDSVDLGMYGAFKALDDDENDIPADVRADFEE